MIHSLTFKCNWVQFIQICVTEYFLQFSRPIIICILLNLFLKLQYNKLRFLNGQKILDLIYPTDYTDPGIGILKIETFLKILFILAWPYLWLGCMINSCLLHPSIYSIIILTVAIFLLDIKILQCLSFDCRHK